MRFSSTGWSQALASLLLLGARSTQAYELDPKDPKSIKDISFKVAHEMMVWYGNNDTKKYPDGEIGVHGDPYHWWESGAAFAAMIDYWYYTGDAGNNKVVQEAILAQIGANWDFNPEKQNHGMGNDDQCFWALTSMSAAEKKFPDPPKEKAQYLALSQAVFNNMAIRLEKEIDEGVCGGGLRWQVLFTADGYTYKNSVSNACFFQLGARLARYTGNETYAELGTKAYDWMEKVELITDTHHVRDGVDVPSGCIQMDKNEWSYNVGMVLAGCAYMYNFSERIGDKEGQVNWKIRTDGFLERAKDWFKDGILNEKLCEGNAVTVKQSGSLKEPTGGCNVDQRSFKAYLARFMGLTVKMLPETADTILGLLETSAVAAAKSCSNGPDGKKCGMKWTTGGVWDELFGLGEQMSALETIQTLLINSVAGPADQKSGTSKGDSSAGFSDKSKTVGKVLVTTTADRAGAAILTVLTIAMLLGLTFWLFTEEG